MNLSHYSHKPLGPIKSVKQRDDIQRGVGKPLGLWISVDGEDDWQSWCIAEGFSNPDDWFQYRITLNPTSNVLILKNSEEIRAFTKQYTRYDGINLTYYRMYCINWHRVASEYQGIIIAPYCWELRLDDDHSWYYAWDCASGCIWDAAAIKNTELIREPIQKAA